MAPELEISQTRRSGDVTTSDYVAVNRANWNERVEGHLVAYGADDFVGDPSAISGIVREDAEHMAPFLPRGSVHG